MAVAASRALKLSNMTRDPGLGGSIDSSRDLFRLKEEEDKRYPELSPDAVPQKNRVLEQAIVEPSNLLSAPRNEPSNSNIFEGFTKLDEPSLSIFDGFTKLDAPSPAAPKTMAEADKVLNPELEMAGGTPQESHSQLHEKARVAGVLAKHGIAGAIGGAPDLLTTLGWDLPAVAANHYLGTDLGMSPKVSHGINEGIDYITGGATKTMPDDRVAAAAIEGGANMFGGGVAGKGAKSIAEKAMMTNPSKWLSRIEKFSEFLGSTSPSLVAAGAAGGAASQYMLNKDPDNPLKAAGAGLGAALTTTALTKKVAPAVANFVSGTGKYLGSSISPKIAEKHAQSSIKNILKNEGEAASIRNEVLNDFVNGDAPYVSKEVLTEFKALPAREQAKLAEKHADDYLKFLMEIEERQGIALTAGEITGSPKLRKIEDSFANNQLINDMGNFLTERKLQLTTKMKKLIDSMPGDGSSYNFGVKTDTAITNNLERLKKIRTQEWNKDFGAIVDQKVIPVPELADVLTRFATREASNEGYKVSANLAKEKLNLLIKSNPEQQLAAQYGVKVDAPMMSPKQINDWLVGFNEDLRRIPAHKRFATKEVGEIKRSLEISLDNAAQSGDVNAALVQKAREGFAKNSKIINEIEESYMYKKLENTNTPERITKAFKSAEPSEVRQTIAFLEGAPAEQDFLKDIQKYYLETAVSSAAEDGGFSVVKFLKTLPKKEVLDEVFKDASMHQEIKETMRLMNRIRRHGAKEGGSPTAMREVTNRELRTAAGEEAAESSGEIASILDSALRNDGMGFAIKVGKKVSGSIKQGFAENYQRSLVNVLTSKEKRDELIKKLLKIEKSVAGKEKSSAIFKSKEKDGGSNRSIVSRFMPQITMQKQDLAKKKEEKESK